MPNLGVYIPDQLHARLQRLRARGIDLNASNVASQALEAAVNLEEKALEGDRVSRLVARLRSARTPREAAEGEGDSAGRQWAEDIAAMSELRSVNRLLDKMEAERLDIWQVHTGVGVSLQFVQWEPGEDSPYPLDDFFSLPDSVPKEFFERAKGDQYQAIKVGGFMRGAVDVLRIAEKAIDEEAAAKKVDQFRQLLTATSEGVKSRRKSQTKG